LDKPITKLEYFIYQCLSEKKIRINNKNKEILLRSFHKMGKERKEIFVLKKIE